jgi:hypothetical protein
MFGEQVNLNNNNVFYSPLRIAEQVNPNNNYDFFESPLQIISTLYIYEVISDRKSAF